MGAAAEVFNVERFFDDARTITDAARDRC